MTRTLREGTYNNPPGEVATGYRTRGADLPRFRDCSLSAQYLRPVFRETWMSEAVETRATGPDGVSDPRSSIRR